MMCEERAEHPSWS